jgi:hypothetical protein
LTGFGYFPADADAGTAAQTASAITLLIGVSLTT